MDRLMASVRVARCALASARRGAARGLGRRLAVAVVATLLAGCAPAAATVEGDGVKRLYDLFLVVGAVIFVLVAGLIGWSIVRYRAPPDADLPPQTAANVKLELIWWALPTILVIVLFVLTAGVLNRVDARVADGESLVVRVTGFQWQWRFEYQEAGVAITGTPEEPPVVVLPVDRTITLLFDSPDVQHAFYVPSFLFKRDVVPGIENRVDLTIQEPATYAGQCAEFCGLLHDQMRFSIRAVSGDEFDAWLAGREPAS
jgi:cytochrome c oxidase subunit 2